MNSGRALVSFSSDHPRFVAAAMVILAAALALAAALPTLWPETFPMLQPVAVDTDPENMLSKDEPVRVFHNEMKRVLELHDIVVVGVVNDQHPEGVFNTQSLNNIYELTQFAKTLEGETLGVEDPDAGIVEKDIIAPSTVDHIEQGGLGTVRFEWLMAKPPETEEEAVAVRKKALQMPFLKGTLVSEDGKAVALYLPLTAKDLSYKVYSKLRNKIAELPGDDHYYITGLPVAEDVFGVEMFKQMAISAPLAMLVIFLLMLFFFRKLVLILSPLIIAMVSVIVTMALLVVTGNTIHIMSSMIPIFIMPIAVLDSVHILSEFFDQYQKTKDRRKTIASVVETLFAPMLYTSLTSTAGFASLALTPIPPVQVFGVFVALGIMFAWAATMTFIPAYIMFIPARTLENFGTAHTEDAENEAEHKPRTALGRFLAASGRFTYARTKLVLTLALIAVAIAVYGITKIQINDNPIKWFQPAHTIRVADTVLNEHFGGTYMAYLALRPAEHKTDLAANISEMAKRMAAHADDIAGMYPEAPNLAKTLEKEAERLAADADSKKALLSALENFADKRMDQTEGSLRYAWEEMGLFFSEEQGRDQIFKRPDVLRYMGGLQEHVLTTGVVGKSNSLGDLVKTVHRELYEGNEDQFRIPDSAKAVAQCLITYESSHRPQDLWHFVTPDYRLSSIWLQLKSGDNKDMEKAIEAVADYVAANPPPAGLEHQWFGLTYINVIWQDKMVSGMLQAFLGSFLVVLLMMTILFRSSIWGLLSMIPLTVTIGLIYGIIGLIGKDYDMPVAVLSSMTLGLAVDFAIHFLARARVLYERTGSWRETYPLVFGEPARAIARNVIVIAVGFLPLLAAPLVPYQTVGVFLASILLVSGAGTLLILPALIKTGEKLLFPKTRVCCITCQCATCIMSAVTFVALIVVNIRQFFAVGWTRLTWISLIVLAVLASLCGLMSYLEKCRAARESNQ